MTDFTIDDVEMDNDIAEQLRESQERVAESLRKSKWRAVTHAFAHGYDGVDIVVESALGWEVRRWNHCPPTYGPLNEPVERHDFRGLTFDDLRPVIER